MIRGTTPTLSITVNGIDLSEQQYIHVTLKQDMAEIDLTEGDNFSIDGNTISIWLTQEQSLNLHESTASLQVNGLTADKKRWASNVVNLVVTRQLLNYVIGEDQ